MILLFYFFSSLTLFGSLGVVFLRNQVSCALSLICSFLGLAGLFIQLEARLIGILQILVYAGAVIVLFIFIIMLLDFTEKKEKNFLIKKILIPIFFVTSSIIISIFIKKSELGNVSAINPNLVQGNKEKLEIESIGELLFTQYWFPIQLIGVLLLVSTIGAIVLSKKTIK